MHACATAMCLSARACMPCAHKVLSSSPAWLMIATWTHLCCANAATLAMLFNYQFRIFKKGRRGVTKKGKLWWLRTSKHVCLIKKCIFIIMSFVIIPEKYQMLQPQTCFCDVGALDKDWKDTRGDGRVAPSPLLIHLRFRSSCMAYGVSFMSQCLRHVLRHSLTEMLQPAACHHGEWQSLKSVNCKQFACMLSICGARANEKLLAGRAALYVFHIFPNVCSMNQLIMLIWIHFIKVIKGSDFI